MKTKVFSFTKLLLALLVGSAFSILCIFTVFNVGYRIFYSFVLYPMAYINVSGTGSMYPTFPRGKSETLESKEKEVVATPRMIRYPNGFSFNGKEYFRSQLAKGDLVSFYSGDKALIKRILGVPGDIIEIRNGLVYINDEPQKEPYTSLPHSTFGGDFAPECKKIQVPENSYFVLGDNRKESNDSRFDVGFVNEKSIDTFLPLEFQKGIWDKNWRDTSKDLENSTKIKLGVSAFVKDINQLREKSGKPNLTYKAELEHSATLRAENIFITGLFDEKAEGAISTAEAFRKAGYWRPVYGEIPVQGYFSSDELFNYLAEFDTTKDFILDKDFTEIGLAVVEDSLNNCPTQLIVIHFSGYVPPNYDKDTIDSWNNLLKKLKEIKPGWEEAKNYDQFYEKNKRDIDKVISIINDRIDALEPIVAKMKQNEWLSETELKYLDLDASLGDEQENLANKLNDL
ncbi:signal peptidase I [candidate division WWE3 bacterium]|uniref:Signal peptidase I n=1 Tax=candidate division WWE3 bacterium TaxID=2053526 RepID=A0A7X9DKQ0_UNCKA|nr:signal peptidase I [candidate division WWE3 bacterium]